MSIGDRSSESRVDKVKVMSTARLAMLFSLVCIHFMIPGLVAGEPTQIRKVDERRAALAERQPQEDVPQEPAYAPGDRVVHAQFGRGVVVSCELVPGDQQVVVAFEGRGVKKLMLSFAPLAAEDAETDGGGDGDGARVESD